MAGRKFRAGRVRQTVSTRKRIKLTDDLFNKILDNYKSEFEDRLTKHLNNPRALVYSPLFDEGYLGRTLFPFSTFTSYRLTIPQFKKVLDFCFNDNDYDPIRPGDPWIVCISKYSLALKIFHSCIAPNRAYSEATKITKKVEKCYELYLERLVNSKLPGITVLSYGLISYDLYGLGAIGSRYLSKFDFYKTDDKALYEEVFSTYNPGFNYRGYNNARTYNTIISSISDDEFLDVVDVERFKIEDNFPYTKEEVSEDDEV